MKTSKNGYVGNMYNVQIIEICQGLGRLTQIFYIIPTQRWGCGRWFNVALGGVGRPAPNARMQLALAGRRGRQAADVPMHGAGRAERDRLNRDVVDPCLPDAG